jgi:hypothetical protein
MSDGQRDGRFECRRTGEAVFLDAVFVLSHCWREPRRPNLWGSLQRRGVGHRLANVQIVRTNPCQSQQAAPGQEWP